MKILKVSANQRKKCFEVRLSKRHLCFPFSRLRVRPSTKDRVATLFVDRELGRKAFTYRLASGKEDSILLEQILEYANDPDYVRNMLLYKMTLEAQKALRGTKISKREIVRRLATSPAQLYRLLDQTNTRKSLDEMVRLLTALDCPVDLVQRKAA